MTAAIWSVILPLAIVVVSKTSGQLTYLTEQDFRNAALLPANSRRMRPLYNDQRFLTKRSKRAGGVGVASASDKWPGGRIPYVLSAAYTEKQRAVIARAIAGYQTKTCIRFVPKTAQDRDFIVISKLDGCYADFARVGGRQQVSLADECIDYATIIHELMHVIGFIHEHQREDRDGYVNILYQNIIPGANSDFDKLSSLDLTYYGENYDYLSIMHYEKNEGSRNGQNTIEAKPFTKEFMSLNIARTYYSQNKQLKWKCSMTLSDAIFLDAYTVVEDNEGSYLTAQKGEDARYMNLMGKSTDFSESDLKRVNRAYSCWGYMNRNG